MKILKWSFAFVRLLWIFFKEFIVSNVTVAYTILFIKQSDIHPNIVDFNTDLLTKREVLILAQLVTLTPGTISVEINEKEKRLKIHMLNSLDPQKDLESIRQRILPALLGVTRC